ncbi:MAG: hypothetical protein N4A33_03875 [Bacteriovoracaceae bacterium]|jgi:D-3-phosphoglycerate dehydrogenase|nr:hypothetical protein [Bacteriovoracaceae bacterium]
MKIQVLRLSSSAYQEESFFINEKKAIESIHGVTYQNDLTNIDMRSKYILISNTHTVPEKIANHLIDNTILMIHPNSGSDNFSQEFINKVSFPIVRGNEIRAAAVCEYILSCVFTHLCKLPNHWSWDSQRKWNRSLLSDKKILILGYGHIGKRVYNTLKVLAHNITVVDPKIEDNYIDTNLINKYDQDLFDDVQLLILCTDLNQENNQFIDKKVFEKISSDCLIINSSRGQVINQEDILQFLSHNKKAFAYLDVFQNEPFSSSEFPKLMNLNKTSHIAGVHKDLGINIINFEKNVIKSFLQEKDFKQKYKESFLNEVH